MATHKISQKSTLPQNQPKKYSATESVKKVLCHKISLKSILPWVQIYKLRTKEELEKSEKNNFIGKPVK